MSLVYLLYTWGASRFYDISIYYLKKQKNKDTTPNIQPIKNLERWTLATKNLLTFGKVGLKFSHFGPPLLRPNQTQKNPLAFASFCTKVSIILKSKGLTKQLTNEYAISNKLNGFK
jgi:hypothetical protein